MTGRVDARVWGALSSLLILCTGCGILAGGGQSVLCGASPQLDFRYAQFEGPRTQGQPAQPIWTGTRAVVLGDSTGVGGADVTDLRIVSIGSAGSVSVGGGAVLGGNVIEGGSGETEGDDGPGGPWRLDVELTSAAAARLGQVADEIAGSYRVLALVVGDEVFSASVELPIRFGVARIELPTSRSQDSARAFFRDKLGCKPGTQ